MKLDLPLRLRHQNQKAQLKQQTYKCLLLTGILSKPQSVTFLRKWNKSIKQRSPFSNSMASASASTPLTVTVTVTVTVTFYLPQNTNNNEIKQNSNTKVARNCCIFNFTEFDWLKERGYRPSCRHNCRPAEKVETTTCFSIYERRSPLARETLGNFSKPRR